MVVFNIDIISDPVCIFCYIGKKRLDKAIELHRKVVAGGSEDSFNITWHPFYLDPTMATEGTSIEHKLAERYGADNVERKKDQLRRLAQCDGIDVCTDNKIGNTRDAHRLLELAKRKGIQHAVADALFRLYFEQSGDITSHDMLVSAGRDGGLDAAETRAWLESDEGGMEVDREVEAATEQGVHGVPKYTINGSFQIDGAQDVQTFLEEFSKARDEAL